MKNDRVRDQVELKGPKEIARIRDASRIVAEVLQEVSAAISPGVTTGELDRIAERATLARGAQAAFKGYHGYPAVICVSVNDEVVHGIPSPKRALRAGDVVGLDFGVCYQGYYGDAASTVVVGQAPTGRAAKLLEVTRQALAAAIAAATPDARIGDLGHAVQSLVERSGFSVVRDFVGHGIGRRLHEPPQIPNFGEPGTGVRLRPGMVLAIEPMVNVGGPEVRTLEDGWTAVTADGSLSAHFEHTVVVTEQGPEILSLSAGEGA